MVSTLTSERPTWYTISENARIGDCYQGAKFHACISEVHNLPEISCYAGLAGLIRRGQFLKTFYCATHHDRAELSDIIHGARELKREGKDMAL